jgi:rfaE bifunctional protein nucleotidyltransferase chain/domain
MNRTLYTPLEVSDIIEKLEYDGKKKLTVVQASGCFDLLHPGHVVSLQYSASLGDLLVVSLNGDRRVQELKNRATLTLRERAIVISALRCVDYVTWFDEDLPSDVIRILKPDIYVKGSDYKDKAIPEEDAVNYHGGRKFSEPLFGTHGEGGVVRLVPDHITIPMSSTDVLNRIKGIDPEE